MGRLVSGIVLIVLGVWWTVASLLSAIGADGAGVFGAVLFAVIGAAITVAGIRLVRRRRALS